MEGGSLREYRVITAIAEGGMGEVYLVEHAHLGRRFVLKSISSDLTRKARFQERFFKEAQAQAQLIHSNIVQVTDFFEEGGRYFIVMEYIEGQTLDHVILKEGRLDEDAALTYFLGVLRGLAFAHQKGVIHRELKPSNILVDQNGVAKLTGFGVVSLPGEQRFTASEACVSPGCYMSPEQVVRPKTIDQRSDIFSVGMVLYKMLSGAAPFRGETGLIIDKGRYVKVMSPPLADVVPGISTELSDLALKALAQDPSDRYQSCEDFLAALRLYLGLGPQDALRPEPQATGSGQAGRSRSIVGQGAGQRRASSAPGPQRAAGADERESKSGPIGGLRIWRRRGLVAGALAALLVFFLAWAVMLSWQGRSSQSGAAVRDTAAAAPKEGETRQTEIGAKGVTLEVVSHPADGEWFLDGRPMGTTPGKTQGVAPGAHRITVKRQGHLTWIWNLDLVEGKAVKLTANLVPLGSPDPGSPEPGQVRAPQPAPQFGVSEAPAKQAKEDNHPASERVPQSVQVRPSTEERCSQIIFKLSLGKTVSKAGRDFYRKYCR